MCPSTVCHIIISYILPYPLYTYCHSLAIQLTAEVGIDRAFSFIHCLHQYTHKSTLFLQGGDWVEINYFIMSIPKTDTMLNISTILAYFESNNSTDDFFCLIYNCTDIDKTISEKHFSIPLYIIVVVLLYLAALAWVILNNLR